jgi:hypothetical protein
MVDVHLFRHISQPVPKPKQLQSPCPLIVVEFAWPCKLCASLLGGDAPLIGTFDDALAFVLSKS